MTQIAVSINVINQVILWLMTIYKKQLRKVNLNKYFNCIAYFSFWVKAMISLEVLEMATIYVKS